MNLASLEADFIEMKREEIREEVRAMRGTCLQQSIVYPLIGSHNVSSVLKHLNADLFSKILMSVQDPESLDAVCQAAHSGKTLKSLSINYLPAPGSDETVQVGVFELMAAGPLHGFTVSQVHPCSNSWAAIADAIEANTILRALNLDSTAISEDGLTQFVDGLCENQTLESLRMDFSGDCPSSIWREIAVLIRHNQGLSLLSLRDPCTPEKLLIALESIPFNGSLECLRFSGLQGVLDVDTVNALTKLIGKNDSLIHLELGQSTITMEAAQAMHEFLQTRPLKLNRISICGEKDSSLEVTQLLEQDRVRYQHLGNISIRSRDSAVKCLTALVRPSCDVPVENAILNQIVNFMVLNPDAQSGLLNLAGMIDANAMLRDLGADPM